MDEPQEDIGQNRSVIHRVFFGTCVVFAALLLVGSILLAVGQILIFHFLMESD